MSSPRLVLDVYSGSVLYGLARADSDIDRYRVVDRRPAGVTKELWAEQTIDGTSDVVTTDLKSFVARASRGTPQVLEAMFAPAEFVLDDLIGPYRRSYYVGGMAVARYRRTIRSFALSGNRKKQRHALRLAHNLKGVVSTGRFDPHLGADVVATVLGAPDLPWPAYVAELRLICPVDLGELPAPRL